MHAAVLQMEPSLRLPDRSRFQSREIPKPVTYPTPSFIELLITRLPSGNGLHVLRTASSWDAVRRLSYQGPRISPGASCARIPPCSPAVFLRPHQPSSAVRVKPLQYLPRAGLNPLSHDNRSSGHCLPDAVSVSPNLGAQGPRMWNGSKEALQPPAPVVAAPAPLRARGFSTVTRIGDSGRGASAPVS